MAAALSRRRSSSSTFFHHSTVDRFLFCSHRRDSAGESDSIGPNTLDTVSRGSTEAIVDSPFDGVSSTSAAAAFDGGSVASFEVKTVDGFTSAAAGAGRSEVFWDLGRVVASERRGGL